MVKINGTAADLAGQTVAQHLAQAGWDAARLACGAQRGHRPRARYGETVLEGRGRSGDRPLCGGG
ncbi:MAG: thiamine biosynthesis protein ThiS [Oscillospiraceae bacterium]